MGLSSAALALDGADLYMKKACFSCHGKDAKTPVLRLYPRLAGQSAEYAFAQMMDIKSGARSNGQTAAMKGIMHLVNEGEMRAIADWPATVQYFAALVGRVGPVQGNGNTEKSVTSGLDRGQGKGGRGFLD